MASIRKVVNIEAPAGVVWDALRDVGALHTRLVPGFVSRCELRDGVRTVTFFNGLVARERIVTVDDEARRVVWSAFGGRLTHHNASAQVREQGRAACLVEWVADLLPDEMATAIAGLIEQGLHAMKVHAQG